ncbi:MAG: RNA 2',3'-cyclic phosphodiesterase [Bacteroidales bacterium]
MRQFIAIPLPSDVRQAIKTSLKPFGEIEGLKLVKPENLHLTLVFLGNKGSEDKIRLLDEIKFEPFRLKSSSVEIFPGRKPRIIWIELDSPDELTSLRQNMANIFGINEKFRAHITIARIKQLSAENKKTLIEMTGQMNPFVITFPVDHFNLYNSDLKSDGPVYSVVRSFHCY